MEAIAAALVLLGFGLDVAGAAWHSAFAGWVGMILLLGALVTAINGMRVSD